MCYEYSETVNDCLNPPSIAYSKVHRLLWYLQRFSIVTTWDIINNTEIVREDYWSCLNSLKKHVINVLSLNELHVNTQSLLKLQSRGVEDIVDLGFFFSKHWNVVTAASSTLSCSTSREREQLNAYQGSPWIINRSLLGHRVLETWKSVPPSGSNLITWNPIESMVHFFVGPFNTLMIWGNQL